MQNLVVVSHTVCAHVGGPRNFGDAAEGPAPWDAAWLTPRNTLLPRVCHRTKFRRCRSNRFSTGRRSQKFGGRWGPPPLDVGLSDHLEARLGCDHINALYKFTITYLLT